MGKFTIPTLLVLSGVVGTGASPFSSTGSLSPMPIGGGCGGSSKKPAPNTFVVDASGPKEDATHTLDALSRSNGLNIPPALIPYATLPDWNMAEGRVRAGADVCQLTSALFSEKSGALVALVHVRKADEANKPSYNRWLWVDRWTSAGTTGQWRGVLIDVTDPAQRDTVSLELITISDTDPWPPSSGTRAGLWNRDPTNSFDRVLVMLGPERFLATTRKLSP